ncbi:imidazoleglycerol-phosphate dehydratase HisB [Sinanaerobacter sp. ZZT-01]|uniref:imidazoleglycerol-phosphate dehydratase HisB n=1 Tax=Sinanaerobacter sp. ZZT-01 TaxID=3111540 RepID=UPI002D7773DF|nr:imidazoleglycerol-phosphate dehydratase HisB [Sinanaerobacter sp. ZZT-01]WRR92122.1 imidazoleglycerol-phosphate dehydratase HisB [Sinanaerobacter sp. ZZT-01]
MRKSRIIRETKETKIELELNLDGSGIYQINTGCGFLNHMLDLFAKHGRFDLRIACKGDVEVDDHHTVEDVGIALGSAFMQAVGEKRGIRRYGNFLLPMDEALILCALDISGRSSLVFDAAIPTQKVGTFDTELVQEFLLGFCRAFGLTLHVKQLAGENSHHIIEAIFKSLGRALNQAISIDINYKDEIPSTKGSL